MIKSKTVLVVGAGASKEAGFPIGSELTERIASLLDYADPDRQTMWHAIDEPRSSHRGGDDRIKAAVDRYLRLRRNGVNDQEGFVTHMRAARHVSRAMGQSASIDNFLEAHAGDHAVELMGKLAIVRSILNAEAASTKMMALANKNDVASLKGTWFQSFFQKLVEGVHRTNIDMLFDNISIVTFNYDRCLELFLTRSIANYYGITIQEACDIVDENLEISHVYGSVGPLYNDNILVPFGETKNADLLACADRILTFSENLKDDDLKRQISNSMSAAERVVFLGFAYHDANLKLLGRANRNCHVIGSRFMMSDEDAGVVRQDLATVCGMNRDNIMLYNLECHALFGSLSRIIAS